MVKNFIAFFVLILGGSIVLSFTNIDVYRGLIGRAPRKALAQIKTYTFICSDKSDKKADKKISIAEAQIAPGTRWADLRNQVRAHCQAYIGNNNYRLTSNAWGPLSTQEEA